MNKQSEQKEPWQMTRAEYARQRKLRAAARQTVAEEQSGRRQMVRETGFPQGRVYGLIEKLADLPSLEEDHRQVVEEALSHGLPVPPEVLVDYPGLVCEVAGGEEQMPDAGEACQAEADLLGLRRALVESIFEGVLDGRRRGHWSGETRRLATQIKALKAVSGESRGQSGPLPRKSGPASRKKASVVAPAS